MPSRPPLSPATVCLRGCWANSCMPSQGVFYLRPPMLGCRAGGYEARPYIEMSSDKETLTYD